MGQGKAGWWIAGAVAGIVLISVGYGMGRRASANLPNASGAVSPAGAPLPTIQIEPIQPHEELNAVNAASNTAAAAAPAVPPATASPAAAVPTTAASSAEDSARVRDIQRALKLAGFDPGPVDGHMGQRTKTAIRDFQVQQGLEPDGKVGPKTWSRLEAFLKKGNTAATASNKTPGD